MRQSERRRLAPVVDLTSDLNSEADFNMSSSQKTNNTNGKHALKQLNLNANHSSGTDSDIKTPDFDEAFQVKEIISMLNVFDDGLIYTICFLYLYIYSTILTF